MIKEVETASLPRDEFAVANKVAISRTKQHERDVTTGPLPAAPPARWLVS